MKSFRLGQHVFCSEGRAWVVVAISVAGGRVGRYLVEPVRGSAKPRPMGSNEVFKTVIDAMNAANR